MGLRSRKREYKPDLTVEEAFKVVPNKPDRVRRRRREFGKYTRKGLCHFVFEVLELNETLPASQKKTNAAIVEVIVREFPTNYQLHVRLRKAERTSVNYYRQKYNTGILIPGRPIRHVSFRYNEQGERVDYHTGKKRLSVVVQNQILQKYRNKFVENYKKYYDQFMQERKEQEGANE